MIFDKPQLPPFICMKGTKQYSLYTYKNGWDAEKGRSYRIPGSTKSAGVILSGTKTGKIKWNEQFLEAHKELEHFEATRLDDGSVELRYLDEEVTVTVKEALAAKRLAAGATWTLDFLLDGSPFLKALKSSFGECDLYRKILSLAYFLNIADGNAATRYECFAETHRLPWPKPLSQNAISRLFQQITQDKIDRFFRTLGELTADRDDKYWVFDSASVSTCSAEMSKAAGLRFDEEDNILKGGAVLAVNQITGEPAYFRDFAGTAADMAALKHELKEHSGIRLDSNAAIVAGGDCGSLAYADRFCQNGISFILNIKPSSPDMQTLFQEAKEMLLDPLSYSLEIRNHAVTVETERSYSPKFADDCSKHSPKLKEKMYVHFFYSQDAVADERSHLTSDISAAARMMRENKEMPGRLAQIAEKFLIAECDENKNIVSIAANKAEIDKYLEMKGVLILASNAVSDAAEAFKACFDRCEVEKAFNNMKRRLGASRMRASTDLALEGKTFVQFVASSIALMLRKRISNALKRCDSLKLHYGCELAVIDKLETIKETKFSFGACFSETVGGLRVLLDAMNIPIPSQEIENNIFRDSGEYFKDDPFEAELSEDIYSDARQLQ